MIFICLIVDYHSIQICNDAFTFVSLDQQYMTKKLKKVEPSDLCNLQITNLYPE